MMIIIAETIQCQWTCYLFKSVPVMLQHRGRCGSPDGKVVKSDGETSHVLTIQPCEQSGKRNLLISSDNVKKPNIKTGTYNNLNLHG